MRTKSVVYTRQRKKKYFRLAKGSYATKKNRWRMVMQQVERSLNYAYVARKDNKRISELSGLSVSMLPSEKKEYLITDLFPA